MFKIIIRRLLGMVPVLWVVVTLTFFLIRLAPGGPFDSDRNIPPEILKNILAKYNLDAPLWQQYLNYLGSLLQGDLGPSFRYAGQSVNSIISQTWSISAVLGIAGLFYALCLGVTAGLLAASKPNSLRDYIPMSLSLLGICLPSFVIGPLFIFAFAIGLEWFNVSGWNEPSDLVLPAMSLGTIFAAYIARLSRGGLMDVVRQDFVRTAFAKGLDEKTVMTRHALKAGILPVISFLGPATAGILVGSFVVETIFNIPGLGRFFVQSALNRDYTLVMGMVILFAVLLLVLNLLVDLAYMWIDPRVRYD